MCRTDKETPKERAVMIPIAILSVVLAASIMLFFIWARDAELRRLELEDYIRKQREADEILWRSGEECE